MYTLATAPFFFILVYTLFAMVLGVHFTVSPKLNVCPTHSAVQSSERLKTLSVTILLWQDHC